MGVRIGAIGLLLMGLAVLQGGVAAAQLVDLMAPISPAALERVNQDAEATLLRLYRQSPKAQALIARSFGVLVVSAMQAEADAPGVAQGRGVLIDAVGARSYYNVVASLASSVLGLRGKALILVFSDYESMRAFQALPGWVEGVNGAIQILDDTHLASRREPVIEPIAAFILSDTGLVRGLSLKGSLFIRVPMYLCAEHAQPSPPDAAKP